VIHCARATPRVGQEVDGHAKHAPGVRQAGLRGSVGLYDLQAPAETLTQALEGRPLHSAAWLKARWGEGENRRTAAPVTRQILGCPARSPQAESAQFPAGKSPRRQQHQSDNDPFVHD